MSNVGRRCTVANPSSGNRFADLDKDEKLRDSEPVFRGVKELSLEECLLSWPEACQIATKFSSLAVLNVGTNQLSSLPAASFGSLATTLTTLNLEYNDFTSLAALAPLAALRALRHLHLKGNNIETITDAEDEGAAAPVFSESVQYVDLSYNKVATWSFVDGLPSVFPGLSALRFAHNPVYDSPEPEFAASTSTGTSQNQSQGQGQSDEAYMITAARVPQLKTLNFVTVSASDRANAEMFYLSRIAKQLAAVPEAAEALVLAKHPRYAALCEVYGEPDVVRRQEADPNFLEARLVTVLFSHVPRSGADQGEDQGQAQDRPSRRNSLADRKTRTVTRRIPKSCDMYAVKGIAGRLFGLPPLGLRLVWETGEWDPVAGFDDEVGDSSDEEEAEAGRERDGAGAAPAGEGGGKRAGGWVKREVELRDGPRQLGFCVDGLEARIRVEARTE